MLIKLMKYDLKSILKTLTPLLLSALGLSALFAAQVWLNPYAAMRMATLSVIIVLVLLLLFLAVLVVTVSFIIQRFWNGLLKEEGYLMFTLPIRPRLLIFSKAISALVVIVISAAVGIACVLLCSSGAIVADADILGGLTSSLQEQGIVVASLGQTVGSALLVLLCGIYRMYAAMSIGQLSGKNRFTLAFLAYMGLSVVNNLANNLAASLQNSVSESVVTLIVAAVELVIYHVVTEYLLTRKLNLE